ncbi:MAG TPA: FlgO family outer membrane protein [Thermohalobaculum sp.]|nr:FlgO family outer membrane protein [Thermohalobaculum sp.]
MTRRHLAAILAADVVGYSALMGRDEVGTLAALRHLRANVMQPALAEHGGTIVKNMGDGWLVEFTSADDAVAFATELQARLSGQTTIRLRIGIHIGDVVHDEDDVFGDGVNVAARLETIAEPGAVVISDPVYGALDGSRRARFVDAGERTLKNIARPLRVWRLPGADTPAEVARPAPTERPAIAVLAFANLSDDASQDHFAEGISEEILHALARCRWLVLAARNSSFAYKGRSADVREIARELGVRYVLDGTVRRLGDRVRITAQLLDGDRGTRLWGERYDRDAGDMFALQSEVAETIAGTVEPELSAIEGAALRSRAGDALTAWECFQLGLWHLYRFTEAELETARACFERAVRLDPGLAPAYARLAYVHIQLGFYGPYAERSARLEDAIDLSRKALALDDRDPAAWVSLGRALALEGGAGERGLDELRTAVALDPSFAQAHFALAQAYCRLDQADEALAAVNEALRLSPHDPHLWTFLNVRAVAHYIAGELDAAAADERLALRQPNVTFWPAMLLVAILGRAGRRDEAAEAIAELHRFRPGMTCADAVREFSFTDRPFQTRRFIAQFRADLLAAGLPEGEA